MKTLEENFNKQFLCFTGGDSKLEVHKIKIAEPNDFY